MTYQDFYSLKIDATEFRSAEDFLGECGSIVDEADWALFPAIYKYAHAPSAATVQALAGTSRAEFAREYRVPLRSLENWSAQIRECPQYLLDLLAFAVISDLQAE